MSEFGERINAHVQLAIANEQKVISEAAKLANKVGVGVFVDVQFTLEKIIITAKPDVRVPCGKIACPDFTKFKLKEEDDEIPLET